jgi:hypothetical protein
MNCAEPGGALSDAGTTCLRNGAGHPFPRWVVSPSHEAEGGTLRHGCNNDKGTTMRKHIVTALAVGACLLTGTASAAGGPPPRTRGTIESVNANTLTMDTRGGQKVAIMLNANTKFASATQAQVSDIKPDSYIGTAAAPQPNGTLKALEVTVFAPSMRGVGDGHYPWDLGSNSSMTNGAVGALQGSNGRTMTVKYKGGEKQVMVPEDAPVVALAPAEASIAKPGAHAVAFATKGADGTLTAAFVVVGENGTVPPM